ncbi:MAG: hypothetical protein K0S01_553 [Herbinix sp.]|jgi:hypothetical protein|nr:hypothetical protein [Herbinix sp.]
MWETIKKDPLIKTIVIILLGVLAFGFAFNIMFGSGSSGMEESTMSMGTGYSLSNTLEVIIALLIKLAIIALLIGIIVWIFRAIGKRAGNEQTDKFAWIKEDPIVKNALIIIGAVIVLTFLLSLFRGGSATGEMTGGNSYSLFTNMSYGIQSFFSLLLKLLLLLSFLGLVYGIYMYLKQNHISLTNQNVSNKMDNNKSTTICPNCNAQLKDSWKCCPHCGSDKGVEDKTI